MIKKQHKRRKRGWVGFDLDGTLAKYDHWRGETHIGEPVPLMVEKVKEFLALGREVRIFTARVAEANVNEDGSPHNINAVIEAIQAWTEKHIGQRLAVTNKKDFAMLQLWDDRAIQILPNLGIRADGRE